MPRSCSVPWCENTYSSVKGKEVTFFNFPTENTLRQKWIDFVSGGSGWIPLKSSTICSDHFSSDMVTKHNSRFLKKYDAVPGIVYIPQHQLCIFLHESIFFINLHMASKEGFMIPSLMYH